MTQIGNSAGILSGNPGYFSNSGRTITYSSPPANGALLAFQVRGWQGVAGSTYDSALAAGLPTGKSSIFTLQTHDPAFPLVPKPDIGSAAGWTGFQIAVPEPSAIALGIIGAGALLMLRRRK